MFTGIILNFLTQVLYRLSSQYIVAVNILGRSEFNFLYFIVFGCVRLMVLLFCCSSAAQRRNTLFRLRYGVLQEGHPVSAEPGAVGRGWSESPQKHWQTRGMLSGGLLCAFLQEALVGH